MVENLDTPIRHTFQSALKVANGISKTNLDTTGKEIPHHKPKVSEYIPKKEDFFNKIHGQSAVKVADGLDGGTTRDPSELDTQDIDNSNYYR